MENAETAETAKGPAPAPTAEGPAPAATLEQPHSNNKEKFSVENFGRPASTYSDFYIWTLFQPGFAKLVNTATFSFFALLHTHRTIYQFPSRTNNLRIYTA